MSPTLPTEIEAEDIQQPQLDGSTLSIVRGLSQDPDRVAISDRGVAVHVPIRAGEGAVWQIVVPA